MAEIRLQMTNLTGTFRPPSGIHVVAEASPRLLLPLRFRLTAEPPPPTRRLRRREGRRYQVSPSKRGEAERQLRGNCIENARRWLLTAEQFCADDALAAGMVTEVVEPGGQLGRAMELAEIIAAQAPLGVQAALASTRVGERLARDAAATEIRQRINTLMTSQDAIEGMAAMMERRDPTFTGQ